MKLSYNGRMSEYHELRRRFLERVSKLPSDFPCREGLARCCRGEIPITQGDLREIRIGVKRGGIAEDAISAAQDRARLRREECPFLDDDNRCSIYNHRPLICIATGIGAIPFKPAVNQFLKVLKKMEETGEDKGFPTVFCQSTMCNECHIQLNKKGSKFSLKALRDMQEFYQLLKRDFTGTTHQICKDAL